MRKNARILVLIMVLVGLLVVPTVASATGDVTKGLVVPDSYFSCDPADVLVVLNVPAGFYVEFDFFHEGVLIGEETVVSTGGNVTVNFPYGGLTGNFSASASVYSDAGVHKGTYTGEWSVTCEQTGGEGCTPGYWRQDQHFDSWFGYSPDDEYDPTFGVDGSFATLFDAVWAKGGGENALARHAVAALLNAVSPDVDYAYSPAEVIAMVKAAYASGDFESVKNQFEYENELGCPLD